MTILRVGKMMVMMVMLMTILRVGVMMVRKWWVVKANKVHGS